MGSLSHESESSLTNNLTYINQQHTYFIVLEFWGLGSDTDRGVPCELLGFQTTSIGIIESLD